SKGANRWRAGPSWCAATSAASATRGRGGPVTIIDGPGRLASRGKLRPAPACYRGLPSWKCHTNPQVFHQNTGGRFPILTLTECLGPGPGGAARPNEFRIGNQMAHQTEICPGVNGDLSPVAPNASRRRRRRLVALAAALVAGLLVLVLGRVGYVLLGGNFHEV